MEEAKTSYSIMPKYVASEFSDYAESFMNLYRLQLPSDWAEALDLYFALVHELEE